jgi:diaminopimelate epimerase
VVLNALQGLPHLSVSDFQFLSDRRYGIGCDQFLIVAPPQDATNDFAYHIVNCDGSLVEQCGNGARCFMRFVRDTGLTHKTSVRVEIATGIIVLHDLPDGTIEVDMGTPKFDAASLPFQPESPHNLPYILMPSGLALYQLNFSDDALDTVDIGTVSMGNPHAVTLVTNIDTAPVALRGAWLEQHPAFPKRVNVGFMQVLDTHTIKLRVWERGAGETLACGTGACAAVVIGIRMGLLHSPVTVHARGGVLNIAWQGETHTVLMRGPAIHVFTGSITFNRAAH